jgi:hypothetical protein
MKLIDEKRITPEAAYEKAIDKEIFAKMAKKTGEPEPGT